MGRLPYGNILETVLRYPREIKKTVLIHRQNVYIKITAAVRYDNIRGVFLFSRGAKQNILLVIIVISYYTVWRRST